jgi:DNA (cytosine-5)-methyltransferase 1
MHQIGTPLCSGSRPKFISLFSGCGGLDSGLHELGFECLGAFDFDQAAVDTYNLNLGVHAKLLDLSKYTPPVSRGSIDALVAGPPCQGFSNAGKRKANDPRNALFDRAIDLILLWRPKVAVLENVPAMQAGATAKHWNEAKACLSAAGYAVQVICFDARDAGVPQSRKRLFMVARSAQQSFTIAPGKSQSDTLGSILRGISGLSEHNPTPLPVRSLSARIAKHIGPGQRLCDVRESHKTVHSWNIPAVFGRTSAFERKVLTAVMRLRRRDRTRDFGDGDPVRVSRISDYLRTVTQDAVSSLCDKGFLRRVDGGVELKRTFNGKYRRPLLAGVAPTVDTHFGDPSMFLHPEHDRAFTVREAARIQTFPDHFEFVGSRRKKFELIGNAVPLRMARIVSKWINELRV